ncbi:MAG: efflux RND transporter periplasmic adaptor subunit [Chitinophagia bacterium]|nr:efflux RND transporter periplasmic adaptor subunit [Chitinophagia bacterium]
MKKLFSIAILSLVIIAVGCGKKSNDSPEVANKKSTLATLKSQRDNLTLQIDKLEKEISQLDPTFAKVENAKLVSVDSPLQLKPFQHFIDLQGKVESENISFVTPRGQPGQVKQIYIKKGDYVNKGQLLLKLDDAIARQSLTAAEQGLETMKVQLNFAKNIYQKQKNLWEQNIGTEVQLITAKNNVETLENQLKAMQEQVKITKEQVQMTQVYSDVSGVAEEVNIRLGETFMGGMQIKIVNTSNLKVTTQVPENYIDRVTIGKPIKISLPDINKSISSNITVTGKIIDPNSRSFYVEAKIPDDKDFHPNQIALVKIMDYTNLKAISVPLNTLQSDEKGKYVMIVSKENNKLYARKRAVTIGQYYGDQLEIKSGLEIGDQIISEGFQGLFDGQLITSSSK